jgi:hypothetical protein
MRRELERRLQQVMRRDLGPRLRPADTGGGARTGEVWIELRDGTLCGPRGERITRDAFEAVCADLPAVVVLPDNERDPDFINRPSGNSGALSVRSPHLDGETILIAGDAG